jgi:hypothetical protein
MPPLGAAGRDTAGARPEDEGGDMREPPLGMGAEDRGCTDGRGAGDE